MRPHGVRGDDLFEGADLGSTFDGVNVVELLGDLGLLLEGHLGDNRFQRFAGLGTRVDARSALILDHARVREGASPNLSPEDDARRGAAADHRRVRAGERRRLEAVVQLLGEDHVGAPVVARHDHEQDRTFEVHDRPGDLGPVLELQFAERFR